MTVTASPLHYSVHSRLRDYHFRRLLTPVAGGVMVDVGCGLGYLTECLGQTFRLRVGLDSDMSSLKVNQQRKIGAMIRSDVFRLPFAPESVDVLICSEVLEHLPDGRDRALLVELARVLKPGGQLLLSVPCLEGWRAQSRLRNLGHDDPNGGEYHYRRGYATRVLCDMVAGIPKLHIAAVRHSMFIWSELFMDVLKLVYTRKHKMREHSDLLQAGSGTLFRIYRKIFPLLFVGFVAEDRLSYPWLGGHILLIKAVRLATAKTFGKMA